MILLIHCYSRNNSGDGLLVDLATDLLVDAGANREDIVLLALDAPSFAMSHSAVVQVPWAHRSVRQQVRGALTGGYREIQRLFKQASLVVAVGGGYMRFGTLSECLKTSVAHLPQLALAAYGRAPAVYLPQSVGPASRPTAALLRALFRRVEQVHVRDDRSRLLLEGLPVRRTPDLAALSVPLAPPDDACLQGRGVALVARALANAPGYMSRLKQMEGLIPEPFWVTQSTGRGNDDLSFMQALGVTPASSLASALKSPSAMPRVVVSVRLHGALESIRSGVPAVHLAYERKGFGAYSDLGIDEFVFDARRFDPASVAEATRTLYRDPSSYWSQVTSAASQLQAHRDRLVSILTSAISDGRLPG